LCARPKGFLAEAGKGDTVKTVVLVGGGLLMGHQCHDAAGTAWRDQGIGCLAHVVRQAEVFAKRGDSSQNRGMPRALTYGLSYCVTSILNRTRRPISR
jgi:hypothetical protein